MLMTEAVEKLWSRLKLDVVCWQIGTYGYDVV